MYVELHVCFDKICMIRNPQPFLYLEALFEYSHFISIVRFEVHVKSD